MGQVQGDGPDRPRSLLPRGLLPIPTVRSSSSVSGRPPRGFVWLPTLRPRMPSRRSWCAGWRWVLGGSWGGGIAGTRASWSPPRLTCLSPLQHAAKQAAAAATQTIAAAQHAAATANKNPSAQQQLVQSCKVSMGRAGTFSPWCPECALGPCPGLPFPPRRRSLLRCSCPWAEWRWLPGSLARCLWCSGGALARSPTKPIVKPTPLRGPVADSVAVGAHAA